MERLRSLNLARSGSVSLVSSSAGAPPYRTGGRPQYSISTTPVSPLGLGTPVPAQGTPYYRWRHDISRRREVGMVEIVRLFLLEIACRSSYCMYRVYGSYVYLIIGRES